MSHTNRQQLLPADTSHHSHNGLEQDGDGVDGYGEGLLPWPGHSNRYQTRLSYPNAALPPCAAHCWAVLAVTQPVQQAACSRCATKHRTGATQ